MSHYSPNLKRKEKSLVSIPKETESKGKMIITFSFKTAGSCPAPRLVLVIFSREVGAFLEKENTRNFLGKAKLCNCINLGSSGQKVTITNEI